MRHYARLNPAKVDDSFRSRAEVLELSDVGAQLGFAFSVLNERGLLRDPNRLDPDNPVPLLTWPFLDYLESLELSTRRLLELGAGNSTLWLQRRFAHVRSFETSPEWVDRLSRSIAPNVDLVCVESSTLEAAEIEYRGEELVLVDFAGRRTRFLHHFLSRLSAERPQAIVLDNADWYRQGAATLARYGYREIPFYGFKCGQAFVSCTSLFVDPSRFALETKLAFHRPAYARRMQNPWDEP